MNANKAYSTATILLVACFVSLGVQAAPRSTPVTVANDSANPVPVTVENQQTAITVDNSSANPVPVTIENQQSTTTVDNTSANPVPVAIPEQVQVDPARYRYVGMSSASAQVGNGGGIHSIHSMCNNQYGSLARMCTTKEFSLSPSIDSEIRSAPEGWYWIHPEIIAIAEYDSIRPTYLDWTGITIKATGPDLGYMRNVTCNNYNEPLASTSTVGLHVTGRSGIEDGLGCHNFLPVVCCAPQ